MKIGLKTDFSNTPITCTAVRGSEKFVSSSTSSRIRSSRAGNGWLSHFWQESRGPFILKWRDAGTARTGVCVLLMTGKRSVFDQVGAAATNIRRSSRNQKKKRRNAEEKRWKKRGRRRHDIRRWSMASSHRRKAEAGHHPTQRKKLQRATTNTTHTRALGPMQMAPAWHQFASERPLPRWIRPTWGAPASSRRITNRPSNGQQQQQRERERERQKE